MGPLASPGVKQATSDATTWVFKDPGEPLQLLLTLFLGGLALYAWYRANKPPVEEDDE